MTSLAPVYTIPTWLHMRYMDKFRFFSTKFPFICVDYTGKNCYTWMGTKPVVHVSNPTLIREILTKYNKYQKPRGGNPLSKLLARGLVDAEGDRWVKHRKIINVAFHMEKLKVSYYSFSHFLHVKIRKNIYMDLDNYVRSIWHRHSTRVVAKWSRNGRRFYHKKSSCEVDVWPHLQTFSGDVISRTAFGSSFEEGRKIFELQRELQELLIKVANSVYFPGLR